MVDERWLRKARSAKIGSMPMMVELDARCKFEVGKLVRFRESERGHWQTAMVKRIDTDGYFQADRH